MYVSTRILGRIEDGVPGRVVETVWGVLRPSAMNLAGVPGREPIGLSALRSSGVGCPRRDESEDVAIDRAGILGDSCIMEAGALTTGGAAGKDGTGLTIRSISVVEGRFAGANAWLVYLFWRKMGVGVATRQAAGLSIALAKRGNRPQLSREWDVLVAWSI